MKTSFKKLFFDRQGHSLKESFAIIYLALRRKFYFAFRPNYVKKMVTQRKGTCISCPCCNLWFWNKPCEFLEGKNCIIHDQPEREPRPRCHLYPFDEKDKTPEDKKRCTLYWDKK